MTYRYQRLGLATATVCLLFGHAADVLAQPFRGQNPQQYAQQPARTANAAQPAPGGGAQRPPAEPLRVEPLSPELEAILVKWEQESSKIKVLQGKHFRQEYNNVFSVEKRAMGYFYYETPDKGRFDLQSVEIKPGYVSKKIDPNTGKPYSLASSDEQGWICTGKEILIINPTAKEFEVHPIPEQMQGEKISQSPLPFLFGMKSEEAKRRYTLKLHGETDEGYYIDAIPKLTMDSQNYKHARIVLSKQTFIPMKVYLLDPAGTLMTEYTFVDVKMNPGKFAILEVLPFFKDSDPFKPKLTGYKLVQQPVAQPQGGDIVPTSGQQEDLRRGLNPTMNRPQQEAMRPFQK